DHAFDGFGAGVGGLFSEESGGGAEREACSVPDRRHDGGADMARGQQLVERVEGGLLLRGDVSELAGDAFAALLAFGDGGVALVDRNGAVFAGMIDAEHFFTTIGGGHAATS